MVDRSTGNLLVFIPLGGPGPKANDSLTVTAPITGGMGWAATPRRGWAATVFDKLVLTLVSFTLRARVLRPWASFFSSAARFLVYRLVSRETNSCSRNSNRLAKTGGSIINLPAALFWLSRA